MKSLLFGAALALGVMNASTAAATTLTFSEADFGAGSISLTPLVGASGGQTAAQTANGISGSGYQVTTSFSSAVASGHLLTGATVSLATQSVLSFGFQVDFNTQTAFGQGMAYGLLVEQDGNYFAVSRITGADNGVWKSRIILGIDSSDFFAVVGGSLDLSQGAADLNLGLYTANDGGQGISVIYDNLSITVTTDSVAAVPLPAGGLLLLSGLTGIAWVRRGKANKTAPASA